MTTLETRLANLVAQIESHERAVDQARSAVAAGEQAIAVLRARREGIEEAMAAMDDQRFEPQPALPRRRPRRDIRAMVAHHVEIKSDGLWPSDGTSEFTATVLKLSGEIGCRPSQVRAALLAGPRT